MAKKDPKKTSFSDAVLHWPAKKFEAWWKKMEFTGDWKDYHKGKNDRP